MLTPHTEQAVAPRQTQRDYWVDCQPTDVPNVMADLDARGMVLVTTERRVGRQGRKLVRLWYQPQRMIEHR
jgi:hypothetical protein